MSPTPHQSSVKAKTTKKPYPKITPELLTVARLKFYGALMANLLHSITNDNRIPAEIREQAKKRHEKWDAIEPYRPLNPISIIEIEKELQ